MSASRERADHAEVDQPQPAVGEHEDVRRVRVAVEDAVAEDHLQPGIGEQQRQPPPLVHRRRIQVELAELGPSSHSSVSTRSLEYVQYTLRDGDPRLLGEVAAEDLGVAGLGAVVELAPDRARELVHHAPPCR